MKNGWNFQSNFHMLSNTRRAVQILWLMFYLGDMLSFLNLEPKFLDLKTYLNFMRMIRILHSPLIVANIEHKEDVMFLRGICLKKGNFVCLKEHIENSLLKRHMKEVSWVISELIKLVSF